MSRKTGSKETGAAQLHPGVGTKDPRQRLEEQGQRTRLSLKRGLGKVRQAEARHEAGSLMREA